MGLTDDGLCRRCDLAVEAGASGGDPALRLTPEHLSALVGAMRAGGVGILRVGSLEIDLTRAPASVPVTNPAPAGGDDDERSPGDVLYRAGAGKRQRLPFGGRS